MNYYDLLPNYGLTLEMLKMAPVLPKTPEEALLLSNLYQVQSTMAKLAAQQELALRTNLGYPTYINHHVATSPQVPLPSSLPTSPAMSPTRDTGSVSPQPHDNQLINSTVYQPIQNGLSAGGSSSAFSTYEKQNNSRLNPYRRKRRSNEKTECLNKRAKTAGSHKPTRETKSETSKKTFLDLYEAYGVIGVGGGGMVYAGRRITDKLPVAIKRVMREKVKRWEKVQGHNVPQEIALMLRVYGHEGVIKLVDWYECLDSFILIMERPENSVDLFDYIREKGKMNEHEAQIIFKQVLSAVNHIHSCGVVHRDIKDENIVLNRETGVVKIIDFGCGTLLKSAPYRDFSGTPEFYPPEWFKKRYYYARSAATWSLGVLLFDMVCGEIPFKSKEKIMENKLSFKHHVSDEVKDLIKQLLHPNPEKRPTVEQILSHQWMQM